MELPIKSNFREGLNITEYFMGARSSRKSLSDTALRTADSGYLTRRLVDVSQEVIVREVNCDTNKGTTVSDVIDERDKNVLEPLADRIIGRFSLGDIVDPATGAVAGSERYHDFRGGCRCHYQGGYHRGHHPDAYSVPCPLGNLLALLRCGYVYRQAGQRG